MRMRMLIPLSSGLWKDGILISWIASSDRSGESDVKHLNRARKNERVIITADEDFLRLEKEYEHQGIIVVTEQEIGIGESVRKVSKIAGSINAQEMKNHVEFI